MTSWVAEAKARESDLRNTILALPQDARAELTNRVNEFDNALDGGRSFADWLTGDKRSGAWNTLHEIELDIAAHTELADVVQDAKAHARRELSRRQIGQLDRDLESARGVKERRAVALRAIREAHEIARRRHSSELTARAGYVVGSIVLFVLAVALVVIQAFWLRTVDLIAEPTEGLEIETWVLLSIVMLIGVVGGAISALVSLYSSGSKRYADTVWFDPRPGLALVKMSLGMWAAVIGVWAVSTGTIVGPYDTFVALMLLSVAFGYASQGVTKFLDRQFESWTSDQTNDSTS